MPKGVRMSSLHSYRITRHSTMVVSFAGPKLQHECRAWWAYALPKDGQERGSICAVANDTGSITHTGYRGSETAFEEHALRDAQHPAGSTGHIRQPRRQNLLTPSRHKWGEYHDNSRVQSTYNEGKHQHDKSIELYPQWYNNFTVLDTQWYRNSTALFLQQLSFYRAGPCMAQTFYVAGPSRVQSCYSIGHCTILRVHILQCWTWHGILYNTRFCMVESPNNTEHA